MKDGIVVLACFFLLLPASASWAASDALDRASIECLGCHSEVQVRGGRICHGGGCDHPIGVEYAATASSNSGLAGHASIDPAMALPGGRIGCTTCHAPYDKAGHEVAAARGDGLLSVDNTGSRLCAFCHRK